MDLVELLAKNVVVTEYEDIPSESIEIEKRDILDIIGALIAGATAPGCGAVVELVREMGHKEESTVMMYGGKAPADNAAFANAIMARALDYEACGAGPCHGSAPTIATAFAMSEKLGGVSGKNFLASVVLGIDLIQRLSSSWKCFSYGWDTAFMCSIFGATAVAGKLLGFNQRAMVDAFGIALNQAAGSWQSNYDVSLMVRVNSGLAAKGGIFSALLAQKGITGAKAVLQGRWGFYNLYAQDEYDPEPLTADLGKKFENLQTGFKMYPMCYGTHVVTEAAIEAASRFDIEPEDISEVIISLVIPPKSLIEFLTNPFTIGEVPQVSAQFSYAYAVANALLRRGCQKEHFTDEYTKDPRVLQLASKVRIERKPLEEETMWLPTEMEIRMNDGRSYSPDVPEIPLGNPKRAASKEQIIEKFRGNIAYSAKTSKPLPREKGEEIITLVNRLEQLDNVNQIVELVVA